MARDEHRLAEVSRAGNLLAGATQQMATTGHRAEVAVLPFVTEVPLNRNQGARAAGLV